MITPVTKLVLNCLRNDPPDLKRRNLQALKEEDWRTVLAEAKRQGVAPLIYNTIKTAFSGLTVPPDVMERLKEAYYVAASRNMLIYKQLEIILAEFNKNNIAVILLKGAHLAKIVYGNIALRSMSDLDLLVKKEDLGRACAVLINQGYKAPKDGLGASEKHVPPFKSHKKVTIELHYNITNATITERFSVEDIWKRSESVLLDGTDTCILCPEDLLIHLCVHTSIDHGFDNVMKAFLDIAQVLRHYQDNMDWNKLIFIARQLQVTNTLYLMLISVKKLLGGAVADHALSALQPADKSMIGRAEELMFGKGSLMNSHLSRLFGNEKWTVKMHYFIRRAFPKKESMTCAGETAMPRLCTYFAYLSRIRYLFRQYGKKVFRAFLNDKYIIAAIEKENKKNAVRDWLAS